MFGAGHTNFHFRPDSDPVQVRTAAEVAVGDDVAAADPALLRGEDHVWHVGAA